MVQIATHPPESVPSANEANRTALDEGQPSVDLLAGTPEGILKKWVAEAIAEQVEKIAEVAVQRALGATVHRPRMMHDLTPITDLPLPTRVAKAQQRMNVKTVAQLISMREEEILQSPNLGDRSLTQLKHVLHLYGRSLSSATCLTRRIHDSPTKSVKAGHVGGPEFVGS